MNLRGCLLAAGLVLASGSPVLASTLCAAPAVPDCAGDRLAVAAPEAEAASAQLQPNASSDDGQVAILIRRR